MNVFPVTSKSGGIGSDRPAFFFVFDLADFGEV